MKVSIEFDDGTELVISGRMAAQEAIKVLSLHGVTLQAQSVNPRVAPAPQPEPGSMTPAAQ